MNILVTGGAGFIGSHLSEDLLTEGYKVFNIDNFNDYYDIRVKRNNIAVAQKNKNYCLLEGDLLDYPFLESFFASHQIDIIIHLAARAGVRPSIEQPGLYQRVNYIGTGNMLEMARIYKIKKFIFASSSSVYGSNKKVPFQESDFVDHPVSPYAATKKAGELLCFTYQTLYDITVCCLRFFTVYGPRQRPDMVISKFTRLIDSGQKIPVYGDGSSKRDYTYISDIINGIRGAMEITGGFHVYNLGEARTITLKELIKFIESAIGKKAIFEYLPSQPGDVPMTFADITLARKELRYNPGVDIETGIKKYLEWYRTIGITRNN